MWGKEHKLRLPTSQEALPGRAERVPVPAQHFVTGARLEPPFPAGTELAAENWVVQDGIVVIPKNAVIPSGTHIGPSTKK